MGAKISDRKMRKFINCQKFESEVDISVCVCCASDSDLFKDQTSYENQIAIGWNKYSNIEFVCFSTAQVPQLIFMRA